MEKESSIIFNRLKVLNNAMTVNATAIAGISNCSGAMAGVRGGLVRGEMSR